MLVGDEGALAARTLHAVSAHVPYFSFRDFGPAVWANIREAWPDGNNVGFQRHERALADEYNAIFTALAIPDLRYSGNKINVLQFQRDQFADAKARAEEGEKHRPVSNTQP
jgi:hypothetical protein